MHNEFCSVCGEYCGVDNKLCAECEAINNELSNDRKKFLSYELGKKEIQKTPMSPRQYEKAIRELCNKIGY